MVWEDHSGLSNRHVLLTSFVGSSFVQFFDASSVQRCMEVENITYHGRKLDVSLALSKKELDGVKQQGPAEKKNLDKRNLLLAKEGGMCLKLTSVICMCPSFCSPTIFHCGACM